MWQACALLCLRFFQMKFAKLLFLSWHSLCFGLRFSTLLLFDSKQNVGAALHSHGVERRPTIVLSKKRASFVMPLAKVK